MPAATKTPKIKTALGQAEAVRRARQLRSGEIVIPLACPDCYSKSIRDSREETGKALCMKCGRTSKWSLVRTIRKQRISRFLRDGTTS